MVAAPAPRPAPAMRVVLASQNMGSILSGLVGIILSLSMSEQVANDWGWRVPFVLGILIAPVGFYIRRNLDETLDSGEAHGSMSAVLSDVLRRYCARVVCASW